MSSHLKFNNDSIPERLGRFLDTRKQIGMALIEIVRSRRTSWLNQTRISDVIETQKLFRPINA